MKKYFSFLILTLLVFASCSDDNDDESPDNKTYNTVNEKLNHWTYDQMDTYYYWYKNLPSSSSLSYDVKPTEFYKSLKYKTDRFSYMDYELLTTRAQSVTTYDVGFHYLTYILGDVSTNPETLLFVTYVKPGTLAASVVERGDLITGINGQSLRYNDVLELLSSGSMLQLTVNYNTDVTIFLAANYQEDPLFLTNTYTVAGKKVGYMIYNHFANGPENANYSWAIKVNDALTKFKKEGISEFILDLRYNRGGYVESGTYIASALAPNRSGKIYTKSKYNDKLERSSSFANRKNNYFADYIKDGRTQYDIPQLDLPRIIVITSIETASASEQIINGLRAYMDVEVLGQTTVGKNQESFELAYDGSEAILSLHPIVAITYSSNVNDPADNDYHLGFDPTIGLRAKQADEVNRSGYWTKISQNSTAILPPQASKTPLGDPNETLLKLALQFIETGNKNETITKSSATRSYQNIPQQVVKDDNVSGAIIANIQE